MHLKCISLVKYKSKQILNDQFVILNLYHYEKIYSNS